AAVVVGAGVPATTLQQGYVYLATNAQAQAGLLSTNYAINPSSLAAVFAVPFALGSTTPAAVTSTALTSVGIVSLNASGTAATTIGGSSGAITIAVGSGNFSLT